MKNTTTKIKTALFGSMILGVMLIGAPMVSAQETQTAAINLGSLTEEQRQELKELRQSGDREAVKEKMEELGVMRHRKAKFDGNRPQRGEKSEAVQVALEAGDYSAFLAALGEDSKILESMTEDIFSKMAEAHTLKQSGDHEGARAIMDELNLDWGHKKGKMAKRATSYMAENLTEEQKGTMQEIRELHQSGEVEAAKDLKEQLMSDVKENLPDDIKEKIQERQEKIENGEIEPRGDKKPGFFKRISNWFKRNNTTE